MEIPTDKEQFELPLFAMHAFAIKQSMDRSKPIDMITAELSCSNVQSRYRTMESTFKDLIDSRFTTYRLSRMQVKEGEPMYYVSNGVVFDAHFHPVMMLSWIIERVGDDTALFNCIRPILRIDPVCFIQKEDSVQKFLCGKFLTTALNLKVCNPSLYLSTTPRVFTTKSTEWKVRTEIEECPFSIKYADAPSISTDNQSLIKAALDNIDDIVS
jgi:hypothetical protein